MQWVHTKWECEHSMSTPDYQKHIGSIGSFPVHGTNYEKNLGGFKGFSKTQTSEGDPSKWWWGVCLFVTLNQYSNFFKGGNFLRHKENQVYKSFSALSNPSPYLVGCWFITPQSHSYSWELCVHPRLPGQWNFKLDTTYSFSCKILAPSPTLHSLALQQPCRQAHEVRARWHQPVPSQTCKWIHQLCSLKELMQESHFAASCREHCSCLLLLLLLLLPFTK